MITDPLGRITSMKDPGQNETKLTYDNRDRIQTMTDPYNNTTSFAYVNGHLKLTPFRPSGLTPLGRGGVKGRRS